MDLTIPSFWHYVWFFWSTAFLVPWLILFLNFPQHRKVMCWASVFTAPFGHLGDPLLGLAMVWVYDCYPFVHTGFVEQLLWRRGVTKREFAPRLAIKALQMIARDLPVERPTDGGYWDSLRGWAEQALAWM